MWLLSYAALAARGRAILSRPRIRRALDRLSGIVVISSRNQARTRTPGMTGCGDHGSRRSRRQRRRRPPRRRRPGRRHWSTPRSGSPGVDAVVTATVSYRPRVTIRPIRLRRGVCALVANRGIASVDAVPPCFRDAAGTAPCHMLGDSGQALRDGSDSPARPALLPRRDGPPTVLACRQAPRTIAPEALLFHGRWSRCSYGGASVK